MAYAKSLKIFSGNASRTLTAGLCEHLGVKQGEALVDRFSNGEARVQIGENIRGCDVFLVNSTSPPVDEHLMELLILIDAAKRASAARVTAVLPHFGYARQDRKDRPRVPITAKLVSNLLVAAGAERILTVDLHCGQIQGFFDIPVDHLSGDVVFANHFLSRGFEKLVVVSPDTGSVARIREFAGRLEVPLAIVDKRRPKANVSEVMNVIGDVAGKHALIFDDMIDTGGTLVKAAQALKERGAVDVTACSTHALFSGDCVARVEDSVLTEILVSDSVPLSKSAAACSRIKVLSIAPLVGEAIRRIHEEESVSSLFV
ncbi:MAG: ribose-phosphate pyrophosphokinase [bacterium]|nr:ribose-phosphate pyrophosphokinase [bacterium]